jgi:hypothetical protein
MIHKLPRDVKLIIVEQMILIKLPNIEEAYKIACILSETCKEFKRIADNNWDLLATNIDIQDLSSRQKLSLLYNTFCQKCKASENTKMYLPIPIRVCCDCFKKITVTELELKKNYHIVDLDTRFYLNKEKIYLIKDLENTIKCKLYEYHLNDYKREIASIMEIDPIEIARLVAEFRFLRKPKLKYIERMYYNALATEQFNDIFDNLEIRSRLFIFEVMCNINDIISKETYDEWYNARYLKLVKLYKAN